MKGLTISVATLAVVLCFGTAPTFAQHGRGGGPPAGAGPGADVNHGPSGTRGPSATQGSEPSTGKKTVSDLLKQNTKLASKIHNLTGMDAQTACSGFKNLGQCVAAAHVAHNLGGSCAFTHLQGAMTGSHPESLGQAIHGCNPNVDAKAEAKKGKKQADEDLKESSS